MMRRMPANVSAAGITRIRRILRRLGLLGVLLALFVAFEVGIRHVPPDGMTVAYEHNPSSNGPTHATYSAPQDQQTINAYYETLNNALVYHSFRPTYIDPPPYLDGCYPATHPQFTFTWHGIPVESWSGYCSVVENAGGISDALMFTYHFWTPPPFGAVPPPPAPK